MKKSNLYSQIYDIDNLVFAWRKARKGKTKKDYVIQFQNNIIENLESLQKELINQTYEPKPLKTFILRDPKTRKISKADFRDRIVHHALVIIIEPFFQKEFIHDSCANQKRKGNLFALKRLDLFKRRVTNNLTSNAFCFKADIKHYFQEVDHEILMRIIQRKIKDKKVISLIWRILKMNHKGMPLGNLTSQFFANVYLHEFDFYVKHVLKIKYYIRYVDDFVILHSSRKHLGKLKLKIDNFLQRNLKIKLHKDKSKIISLSRGINFVGFRNYWHFKLLRKRNIRKMFSKVESYKKGGISKEKIMEIFQGWNAYAKWANSFKLRKKVVKRIYCQ